jgi:hypothetical protein
MVILAGLCHWATADFVTIGYAGNMADITGYGSVGYNYRISSTEITVAQMATAHASDGRVCEGDENYWNDGSRTVGLSAPATY